MFGLFTEKPKPVAKSGSKRLDSKVDKALKKSKGKCVGCHKRARVGSALFCKRCLI